MHADIVAAIADERPLVIISGFSDSNANRSAFERSAIAVEIPRLLHHPFTRRKAHARLAAALHARERPVLFASLSAVFFDTLPLLHPKVRCLYLQHAFLFQPNGNTQHKQWLRFFAAGSHAVREQCRARRVRPVPLRQQPAPYGTRAKLRLLPNAVHAFGEVLPHERIGVLFVGRDSEEKRLNLFLDLARRSVPTAPGRFHFTVVGPTSQRIEGSAKDPVTDTTALSAIYADRDLLVVTSYRGGFPLVIMEAMAHGMAVLSTPVGDIPNRLKNDVAHITSSAEAGVAVGEMVQWLRDIGADGQRLERMRHATCTRPGASSAWRTSLRAIERS